MTAVCHRLPVDTNPPAEAVTFIARVMVGGRETPRDTISFIKDWFAVPLSQGSFCPVAGDGRGAVASVAAPCGSNSGNVFAVPCIQLSRSGERLKKNTPHFSCRKNEGVIEKIFKFPSFFLFSPMPA